MQHDATCIQVCWVLPGSCLPTMSSNSRYHCTPKNRPNHHKPDSLILSPHPPDPPPCALARNRCTRSGCARGGRCTLRATAELRHERGQGALEKSSGGRCVLFAQFLTYYMVRFVHCLSVPRYIYIIKRICFARVIDTIRNTCQNLLGGFQENDMSDRTPACSSGYDPGSVPTLKLKG